MFEAIFGRCDMSESPDFRNWKDRIEQALLSAALTINEAREIRDAARTVRAETKMTWDDCHKRISRKLCSRPIADDRGERIIDC